jgi:leucyl aminopeptidase
VGKSLSAGFVKAQGIIHYALFGEHDPSGVNMTKITFSAKTKTSLETIRTECLVLPVFQSGKGVAIKPDGGSKLISKIADTLKLGDFSAVSGTATMITGDAGVKRVMLIGCGDKAKFDRSAQRVFAEAAGRELSKVKAKEATVTLERMSLSAEDLRSTLEDLASQVVTACYVYTKTLTKSVDSPALRKMVITTDGSLSIPKVKAAIGTGEALGLGANLARELGNTPGNICTPRFLSKQARQLAKTHSALKTTVLDEAKMRELGMGSLLSVGHGSDEPSQLIVMEYRGGKAKDRPYALVGKGITFDTGGISLKPGPKMDEMKFDMGGAASVFGTLHAIATMALPINVVGVVAAAENMPSGRATKPGDVVTSLSGKTIEILNTDAEGRLVLCDALTYVGRYKPVEVVDIATLTGAIIVSLGHEACGIFANDDDLAEALLEAGEKTRDRGWRMPIWDDYQRQLDSKFADMQNIGTGTAGSVTAACFLARFTEEYKWAHLDVAGTAFRSAPKGATGRPVPMLVQYLRGRAAG